MVKSKALRDLFGTADFYAIIGVDKTATETDVKKAYRRAALQYHPDRIQHLRTAGDDGDSAATIQAYTQKFQYLNKIYSILSDGEKRKLYDQQGRWDTEWDDVDLEKVKEWDQYWRLFFRRVSADDVKDFEASYRHSDEEKTDLLKIYNQFDGNMDEILQNVLCSKYEDESRFREIIEKAIAEKTVEQLPGWDASNKPSRVKKREKRAAAELRKFEKEEKKAAAKGDSTGSPSLTALIVARQKDRENSFVNLIDSLEQKYGNLEKASKKRRK